MTMTRISIFGSLLLCVGLGTWYSGVGRTAADPDPAASAAKRTPGTLATAARAHRDSRRRALPKLDPRMIARWRMNSTSEDDVEIDEEQLADEEERDAMLAEDRLPEQRAWRSAWLLEEEDEEWTLAMAEEMRLEGQTLVHGELSVRGLSCRETVCRMFLDLSDPDDAEALLEVEREPNLHYELQQMNPGFDAESDDDDPQATHHFELLVVREG